MGTIIRLRIKPIFHCEAKLLALGPRVGLEPQHDNFALPIPTCWYPKCQRKALGIQCEPVEYTSRWAISCWLRVGHVDFMLFVSYLFALDSQPVSSRIWAKDSSDKSFKLIYIF